MAAVFLGQGTKRVALGTAYDENGLFTKRRLVPLLARRPAPLNGVRRAYPGMIWRKAARSKLVCAAI